MDFFDLTKNTGMMLIDVDEINKVDPLLKNILIPMLFACNILSIPIIILEYTFILKKALIHLNCKIVFGFFGFLSLHYSIIELINVTSILFFTHDAVVSYIYDLVAQCGPLSIVFLSVPMYIERNEAFRHSTNYESSGLHLKYFIYCIFSIVVGSILALNQTFQIINDLFTNSVWIITTALTSISYYILYKKNQLALNVERRIKSNLNKKYQLNENTEMMRVLLFSAAYLSCTSVFVFVIQILFKLEILNRRLISGFIFCLCSLFLTTFPLVTILMLSSTKKIVMKFFKRKIGVISVSSNVDLSAVRRLERRNETNIYFKNLREAWNRGEMH
uniref:G_PROTEIN_RECEP_F1_2 domain-containing protein n=1 Tax=Rhabditophanes sp. KR3021 TaxID=114890 RepID=A0AC35U8E1_9BILA